MRHEAAEALGAIGDAAALSALEEFEQCDCLEVAHTCQLALDRIRWAAKKHGGDSKQANGAFLHELTEMANSIKILFFAPQK